MNKKTGDTKKICKSTADPLILAIETSGRIGSAALAKGPELLAQEKFSAPMAHSKEVFCVINDLLGRFDKSPQQIEQVYISVGPGSFTGLRIAVTIAKTMHLANATKIVAVDTLDAIAQNALDYTTDESAETDIKNIATILDAKRGQFFAAVYRLTSAAEPTEKWKKVLSDCLITSEEFKAKFADPQNPIWLLGEGLVYYKDDFKANGIDFLPEDHWQPTAANIYKLGYRLALADKFADPVTLEPKYIQRPDAKPKK